MREILHALPMLLLVLGACSTPEPESCASGDRAGSEGRYRDAIDLETRCLASADLAAATKMRAFEVRAWAFYKSGDFRNAADDQMAFVRLDPAPSHRTLINLSLYMRKAGRLDESLEAARSAEKQDKQPNIMTQYHLGWTFAEMGRHEEAVTAFTRGITVQPDYAWIYWRRGLSYEHLGRRDEAREDFRKADALVKRKPADEDSILMVPHLKAKVSEYGIS
ncbi:tetratricopeptide repeat protein [Usitatibacter palustris]|nr:tetratricopeptide repeat protein [Usitatibacter palustris]